LSEYRQDPILGHWVIVAPERAGRPHAFEEDGPVRRAGPCPFCPGHEAETPAEILALRDHGAPNEPGWRLRIVPNKFPAVLPEAAPLDGREGLYRRRKGFGAHEVIIEDADHAATLSDLPAGRTAELFEVIRRRFLELAADPRIRYVVYFKNHGKAAGATLEHTHSQLLALPLVPNLVRGEMARARRHYRRTGRCILCELAERESRGARLIFASRGALSLAPYAARAPYETWIVPRRHQSHFEAASAADFEQLAVALRATLRKLDRALRRPAYNLVLHTAPLRQPALPHSHWRLELIPRLTRLAGFEWGAGLYMNPVPPEEAARRLRDAAVE
jgi:UDPglucose--hexose-1-phosphate uridylyltransferase